MADSPTWEVLREKLRSHELPNPLLELDLPAEAAERPASEVLLSLILDRDEDELRFRNSPELRLAAAQAILDERLNGSIPELTFYLRYHWFYEGETEEVTKVLERIHEVQLRPYLGLDDPDLVHLIQEKLYGRKTELDEQLDAHELQVIRLVAWATKDQVPLTLPRALRSLEALVEEIQNLGV